jgi:hypothetical protein
LFAAAATMATGAAGFLAAPAAHAESCTIDGGRVSLMVHPGETYDFFMDAKGSDLHAQAQSSMNNSNTLVDGIASGSIAGNIIDFIVTWGAPHGGGTTHFSGTIGADGIAHGAATGAAAHGNGGETQFAPGPWDSTNRFTCPAAQAPAAQAPAAQPKQAPTVKPNPGVGGVTFHVTDRTGVASQCTYSSEGFTSDSFSLPANGSFDLFVLAVPLLKNRTGTVTCDNGTSANTSVFF